MFRVLVGIIRPLGSISSMLILSFQWTFLGSFFASLLGGWVWEITVWFRDIWHSGSDGELVQILPGLKLSKMGSEAWRFCPFGIGTTGPDCGLVCVVEASTLEGLADVCVSMIDDKNTFVLIRKGKDIGLDTGEYFGSTLLVSLLERNFIFSIPSNKALAVLCRYSRSGCGMKSVS